MLIFIYEKKEVGESNIINSNNSGCYRIFIFDKERKRGIIIISFDDNSITLEFFQEQRFDGEYYPLEPTEVIVIKDGDCVSFTTLCMDVSYDLCFSLDKNDNFLKLDYEIKSKSTMPKPSIFN